MSTPGWPNANNFPQSFRITPTFTQPQMAEFNQMTSGPPKGRATDTVTYGIYAGKIQLSTPTHWTMWRTFFEVTIAFGTIPFLWQDPVTGVSQLYIIPSAPVSTHIAGNVWEVAFTLQEVPS